MNPRNPSSQKWTDLPAEFRQKAAQVFAQNFTEESQQGEFLIDGRIYPSEIVVRAGFREPGRLKQTNFEVSIDHRADQSAMEKLFLGIDVLGTVFETHFEHLREDEVDDVEYPVNWEEFDFEDSKVFLRFSTVNTTLEDEADRILGLSQAAGEEAALLHEVPEAEPTDALARAVIDTDLAHDVSQAIRSGEYRPKTDSESPSSDDPLH